MTDNSVSPATLREVDALLAPPSDPLAGLFDCVACALTETLADPVITLQLTLAIDADERRAAVAALMPRVRNRALQLYATTTQEVASQ